MTEVTEMLYCSPDGKFVTNTDVVFVGRFLTTSPDTVETTTLNEKKQFLKVTESHDTSNPFSVLTEVSLLGIGSCTESTKNDY